MIYVLGKFISFEGCEGCGKSTQIRIISDFLTAHNIKNIVCREPGGVYISEKIRDILLDPVNTNLDSVTELLLFMASRRQVIRELYLPHLSQGVWVLCDRFNDSSLVYQGHCRGLGMELVEKVQDIVLDGMIPDITFLLDIPYEGGLVRINARGDSLNRLDKEDIDFHKKVHEGYQKLSELYPRRIIKIEAVGSIGEVTQRITDKLIEVFPYDLT